MRRREVLSLIGGAAAAWPLKARAQQTKLPTIGFLGSGTLASQGKWVAAFVQRLRELGWVEGRSIVLDYRWAEGRSERISEIAAEFVQRKVDVIVAVGTEAALAAKQATTAIPIVFPISVDPVGIGLVASLARPGGNLTGLANLASDIAAKRLELLREMFPRLGRLAILANAGFPSAALEIVELQRRRAHSTSISSRCRSAARMTSPPLSSRCKAAQRRCTSSAIRCYTSIVIASTRSPLPHACRRYS